NALYLGYAKAAETVQQSPNDPVPLHIRNAPTGLMKSIGYGKGYRYAHNYEDAITDMTCLPDSLAGTKFYEPTDRGFEAEVQKRLRIWNRKKRKKCRLSDIPSGPPGSPNRPGPAVPSF